MHYWENYSSEVDYTKFVKVQKSGKVTCPQFQHSDSQKQNTLYN